MKRFLALALSLLMLLSLMPALGLAEGETIRIAWIGLMDKDTMDPLNGLTYLGGHALVTLMQEKMPGVKFEIVTIPDAGWIQAMETTIAAGEADLAFYTNQVMAPVWFTDHRAFMENDPEFTLDDFEATFTEGTKHYTRYHTYSYPDYAGAIYGLPAWAGGHFYMYDKTIFEQWGLEIPEGPVSYEELLALAQQMTGTNPVTGKQNYGAYVKPFQCEWMALGFDGYKTVKDEDMDILTFDSDTYVEYIKDSPELLQFFTVLKDFIACAPPGAASGTGNEKWMTDDNDVAIMLDYYSTNAYVKHLQGGNTAVTDRFVPFLYPISESGVSTFPEVGHFGVTATSPNKELAWEALKILTMDKEVLNLIYNNYSTNSVPALLDTEGIEIMSNPFFSERYENRLNHTWLTDDYWYVREPMSATLNTYFGGGMTPEQAREAFYNAVVDWVANRQLQAK